VTRREPLEVLTVCGVGMGTSLILKMTVEDALRILDVPARVECTDVSTARGMSPDVVLAQKMHAGELTDLAPVVITVDDFLDRDKVADLLREQLSRQGWLE
jgi:ascorbate PTS system EIIB component